MDTHLTDLDALILKVRDRRARQYVTEAVSAYRSGAYKASVISCWVAIAFDIINKIREIAQGGDAAAKEFIRKFDVASSQRNVNQLLSIENTLLDVARIRFGFIGAQELVQLERLKEDRNLCAHPSFSGDAELFQPTPDLVRTHIVHSVEMMLANAPMQGRAIIDAFAVDLVSPAFPRDREQTVNYVRTKYLSQMRPGVNVNFATVLLKAFVRRDIPDWIGREGALLNSLHAVERANAEAWRDPIRAVALRLMTEVDGVTLANVFPLLQEFPDLRQNLDDIVRIRLTSLIENWDPARNISNAVFAAAGIPEFANEVAMAFQRASSERKMTIIESYPHRTFIPVAFNILERSGSFRDAEARFQSAIIPMADILETSDVPKLLEIILGNGQIWSAKDIPYLLTLLADRLVIRGQANDPQMWAVFRVALRLHGCESSYRPLWERLGHRGLMTLEDS